MPMHVVGYETSASEAALTAITPIPDGIVQISGNDILVPATVNNICYVQAMINSAAATLRVQVTSPSLKAVVPLDVSPIANGLVWPTSPDPAMRLGYSPLPLIVAEPLDVLVQNGAAVMNRAFITFCDGAVKPVSGRMYTIRFTATATLVTATWANSGITFATQLPAGNYQVVGMRVISTNGVWARLFFKGSFFRPGAPVDTVEASTEWPDFRWGNYGVWDQFNNITPPSIDVMGITDTTQIGYLDIIKL